MHYTITADHKISGRANLRDNKTRTKHPQKSRQYQVLCYNNTTCDEATLFRVCNMVQQQPKDPHLLQSTKELFFDRLSDWRRLKETSASDSLRAHSLNMHSCIITQRVVPDNATQNYTGTVRACTALCHSVTHTHGNRYGSTTDS